MVALAHVASGKVREIYEVDADHLLLVATDRVSAYDSILEPPIPDKGRVLTGIAAFWFSVIDTPHHLVGLDVSTVSDDPDLRGRSMLVRRADMLPIECVVRGYLAGSAWREYAAGGGPATEHLSPGLDRFQALAEPIFTPATKASSGHDQNVTTAQAASLVGADLIEELRRRSIEIYLRLAEHARSRGLVLADTKLEFGMVDGELVLADEVGTPDSSRYWRSEPVPGGEPPAGLDKQYVRDWLDAAGWNHDPPPPRLDDDVVAGLRRRYVEAFERLTDTPFPAYLEDPNRWT